MSAPAVFLITTALCAALSAPPIAGEAADFDVTGTWSIEAIRHIETNRVRGADETVSPVCTLRQKGSAISGSCRGPAAFGAADGTVGDQTIVLHWHRTPTAWGTLAGTWTFSGSLGSDGAISGTWVDDAYRGGNGSFTARRTR